MTPMSKDIVPLESVLIADHQGVARFGLAKVIRDIGAAHIIECECFDDILNHAARMQLDIVFARRDLPGLIIPTGIAAIRRTCPRAKLVILSEFVDRTDCLRCIDAGAHGQLALSGRLSELVEQLAHVLSGGIFVPPEVAQLPETIGTSGGHTVQSAGMRTDVLPRMTERQRAVLTCLMRGMTNKEIGRALSISDRTVKMHLTAIYASLGVHNRTLAVAVAQDLRVLGKDRSRGLHLDQTILSSAA